MALTLVPSDAGFISVDTSVGKAFALPLSTDLIGRVITFKDSTGNAASGTITIVTQGGDTFQDGTTTYEIRQAFGSATFVSRSGYWVLQQGNAQVIASSVNADMVTATGSNTAFYMSSVSIYSDYIQAQTSLVVQNGSLSVGNSNDLLPFNVVLFTDGLRDITTIHGFGDSGNWITRVASNDSHYGFGLYQRPYEILTLLSTGYVGVMTSSPMYTLDISGTAFVSTLTLSSLNIIDTKTNAINYLTTSSGVLLLNGAGITGGSGGAGVSQIVAGSNISVDPIGGTGVVTVNATGGLSATNLTSTVQGLGTVGYVSTLSLTSSLVSTTEAITIGIIDLLNNLGSYYGYISSPQLLSTVEGLGSAGYLSSGGQGYFSTLYVNLLPQDAPAWNSNSYVAGNDPEPNPLAVDVYGSARILKNLYVGSTTTVIGTGGVATSFLSTTAVAASSFNLLDPFTGVPGFLTISSGTLLVNNAAVSGGGGTGDVTSGNLVSSLSGLGSLGYVSTLSLRSTTLGLQTSGFLSTATLTSTVAGLATFGYVSTLSLRSTVAGLGQTFASTTAVNAFFSTFSTTISRSFNSSNATVSTFFASNATMSNLTVSTITFDTGDGFIDFPDIRALSLSTFFINTSTVNVGSVVSTQVLEVSSIIGPSFLATSNLVSTTAGITTAYQTAGFLSTANLLGLVSTPNLLNFVSTTFLDTSLTSTTEGLQTQFQTAGFLSTANLLGLISAPNLLNLVSTTFLDTSLTSTTAGLQYEFQTAGFLSSPNLVSTTAGITTAYQTSGFLSSPNLLSTIAGLGSAGYLSSFNAFSMSTGKLNTSTLTFIDINTQAQQVLLVSSGTLTLNGGSVGGGGGGGGDITLGNITSTVTGLGTAGYVSTLTLNSAISSFSTAFGPGGISIANITSTVTGLGTVGYVSTLSLVSTTRGLQTSGFVSTANFSTMVSTPFLDTSLTSTVRNLGQLYLSTIPNNLSTMAIFTSSILASTMTTSSLQVNSLTIGTGTGWVNLGPIQTVAISSIQMNTGNLYTDNTYIGDVSTLNAIQFYGLFGNFNNTVLSEVSTGAGTQEFLVFKGSSTTDRIRFQTTGTFAIETGVSARLWSTTTVPTLSNATPAFVINTSSNVGIQTASPGATLDVAGTSRAVTLSSQQLFFSSVNGGLPLSLANLTSTTAGITYNYQTAGFVSTANFATMVSTPFLNTSLTSTTAGITYNYQTAGFVSTANFATMVSTPFLNTSLASTTGQLQSNIEAWSQYTTTTDITLSNGTGIKPADPNGIIQLKTNTLQIQDANGGWGYVNMGDSLGMYTSSSSESYSIGFSPLGTGSISSFVVVRADGITVTTASVYISSLFLGNMGGTVAGQLTTDGTATDLFWNGSKLNNQTGGGGVSVENLTSTTVGLGTLGYISTPGGGGGGGAIDYVSAFTVSTGYLEVSTISSYVIYSYGIIGTQFLNLGPENMFITSFTDATINATSTIINTNALHVTSSNDARFVITSNAIFDADQATFSNIYCYNTISTYSMAVYGPQTLTVNGLANLTQVGLSSINGTQFPGSYVCQGKLTSNIDIQQTLDTVIPFEVDIDPNGWLVDAGSNTAKFQPTIAGYYTVAFQVWWDTDATVDQDNIQIRKNGNSIAIAQNEIPHNTGLTQYTSKIAYLNGSNDYVDFTVYTGTGSLVQTIFYGGTADSPGTFFSAHLLR